MARFPEYELPGSMGFRSLRDYFAAQALAGGINEFFTAGDAWASYDDFAESCYRMADAMLKARVAMEAGKGSERISGSLKA